MEFLKETQYKQTHGITTILRLQVEAIYMQL